MGFICFREKVFLTLVQICTMLNPNLPDMNTNQAPIFHRSVRTFSGILTGFRCIVIEIPESPTLFQQVAGRLIVKSPRHNHWPPNLAKMLSG